jgi:RNA polymerase sigma-70 factor (ECF subfamily)
VGDVALAEDITADVCRSGGEQAGSGVPSPGWLFVTAKHLILKQRDAAIRTAQLGRLVAEDLARRLGSTTERERAGLVYQALDQLPEDQRELLMAYYWDGLSGAECGAVLGCSTGAVFMRLTRARTQLRRHFDALEANS